MRKLFPCSLALYILGVGAFQQQVVHAQSESPDIWVTAYYAGWSQGWFNNDVLPADDIDYSAVTHIIHFGLSPRADGTFNPDVNSIRESNSAALIPRAHAAGKKVLISIGGWGTEVAFRGATNPLNLSAFVDNLVDFMTVRGYDGIDIDWEVLTAADAPQYTLFIKELRRRLDSIDPRPLLTAAVVWQPAIFAALADDFDQINIMTYDISGAWPGWVVWHNAPVTTNEMSFPSTGRLLPSAETMIDNFLLAGVPAGKLGLGIDFYGYVWSGGSGTSTGGVTAPAQTWTSAPHIQVNVPYYALMQKYYEPERYRWDHTAQASYLSIDNPGAADDKFISYDNELSCARKVDYARAKGLGGVFIWELGGGQLPSQFPNRDRLLQAVKMASQEITVAPSNVEPLLPAQNSVGTGLSPILSWAPSADATFYRLQVATDSAFAEVVYDQSWIVWNSQSARALSTDRTYYWRVQPSNVSETGDWSAPVSFTTLENVNLPGAWEYIANTGGGATVLIPASVTPMIGARLLKSGDAIGLFYERNDASVCAGYGVWRENEDFVLTVWADDTATAQKDGLAPGDSLRFQLWEVESQQVYLAMAEFRGGSDRFQSDSSYVVTSLVGIESVSATPPETVPTAFRLEQNFPNPFNPSTTIRYELPHRAHVMLEVFDAAGKRVATLVEREQPAGYYDVVFQNPGLPSGVYFYRLRLITDLGVVFPLSNSPHATSSRTRKMMIIK
ncbi:MAG: glycosyl hydrolase family 18 protein [Bacteroidota bacterium]